MGINIGIALVIALAVLAILVRPPIGLAHAIDRLNTTIGRSVAWLILLAVAISAINAIIRKLFDQSSNSWLEMQWVLFGAVFLLCAPWTLLVNEHIRIDIVNSRFSKRVRDWVDIVGHTVFLIPLCVIMLLTSVPFAWRSLQLNEQSLNAGGLPQWPAKMLVPLGFALLLLQGFSELAKRVAILRGQLEDTADAGGHAAAAEAEAKRLLEVAAEEARMRGEMAPAVSPAGLGTVPDKRPH